VDVEIILGAAEIEAPGLKDVVWRFLESEVRHVGVPLDLASVLARRAEREPELHLHGAPDDLFEYQSNPLGGWVMADAGRFRDRYRKSCGYA